MQIISWHPRIVYYPNFIDQERAQEIIKVAQARLRKSQLALRKEDRRDENQQVRTSEGAFLSSSHDPTESKALQWLDDKISAVTNIPKQNFEVRQTRLQFRMVSRSRHASWPRLQSDQSGSGWNAPRMA